MSEKLMSKEDFEEEIVKKTAEILDTDILKKEKIDRRAKIQDILSQNINNKRRASLEEELSFIITDAKIEELIDYNFPDKFLMEHNAKDNIVLAMGINPGGGSKILNRDNETKDSILFTIKDDLTENEINALSILNNCYVFTKGYHSENYDLYRKINAKAHWSMNGYLQDDEISKIVKNCEKQNDTVGDFKTIRDAIRKMQKAEATRHDGPYVLFSDLIWYCDGNQSNLRAALKIKDKNFNSNIREIIDLNIEYYNPKMITITNAFASDLVKSALSDDKIFEDCEDVIMHNNVPIVLSGMVSNGNMDKYSKIRLQDRIKYVYDKIK